MLSGKVPFQTKSKNDSASTIMRRIKDGQFDFSSSEWKDVSQKAKDLIQGTRYINIKMFRDSFFCSGTTNPPSNLGCNIVDI